VENVSPTMSVSKSLYFCAAFVASMADVPNSAMLGFLKFLKTQSWATSHDCIRHVNTSVIDCAGSRNTLWKGLPVERVNVLSLKRCDHFHV
jgi:hypothetical protein